MAPKTKVEVPDFPKKLFYKINEVATITGVEAYVLRYWESKFPMLAPEKDENDQRRYRQKDIELLFYIKKLLYEDKYTIAGAVEVLKQEKPHRRKRKGRKGAEAAETPESAAASAGDDGSEWTGDDGETGGSAPSGVDPERLAQLGKKVGAVRKEIGALVADLRKWRSTVKPGA